MNKRILCLAVAAFPCVSQADHSLPIELIEVTAKATKDITADHVSSQAPLTRPTHDAGELLRSVTGMTALRRGGRGFEPIIRGQSQNRLNVITDGAYSYGACPGRMDPPSTYVGLDSFDSVTIIKGHRSVIYGSGGSGGTLLFEHQRPEFEDRSFIGSFSSGYTSNIDLRSVSADVAAGNDQAFIRFFGEDKQSDNYDDGKGNTVASAFESSSYGLIIGGDLTESDYLEFSYEMANEDDIWYAGNGMDAAFADSESYRMKWQHDAAIGFIDSLELKLYRNDVSHLMDNYTVRNRMPMVPNGMTAPSSSDTWGGRLMAYINSENSEWRVGIDHRANDRLAILYMDMGKTGSFDMLTALMWPEVQQRQTGLFAEWDYQLNEKTTLRTGIRYDDFETEAERKDEPAGMMGSATPERLYQQFYQVSGKRQSESDAGFVFGFDHKPGENQLLSVNLSRSSRAPDASEQFIARRVSSGAWIGNPEIEHELHHQLDVTWMSAHESLSWSATVYWNEVSDYIERYKAGSNTLYRNVDASIRGLELDIETQLTNALQARMGLAYTRGDGDNGDLSQISPLEARINLDYTQGDWSVGAEWILSDQQDHIDEDVDVPETTAGFGVLHVYANWNVTNAFNIEAGVENVTDKYYAYHVNTANADPFNPDAVRVTEPGRQLWVKGHYRF